MDVSNEMVLRTLRAQAWERAKGAMREILASYWGEQEQYDRMKTEFDNFVKTVEDEALAE